MWQVGFAKRRVSFKIFPKPSIRRQRNRQPFFTILGLGSEKYPAYGKT
jgi:hypothetical protein